MKRNRLAALLAVPWLLSLTSGATRGDIFVDQPPSVYFGGASDTSFSDQFGDQLWQDLADNFRLPAPAQVSHVTWWGFYGAFGLSTHPPVGDETMRIRFYAARAADGLPGKVLYEESVLNPQRIATGRNVAVGNDVPEFKFDVNLADPAQIEANTTYWLEVVQVGLPMSVFRWSFSDPFLDGLA